MVDGEQRICPRCGAPIDATRSKCPYCLTSYFDISSVNIDTHEPFYLKFKHDGHVFTSLVYVDNVGIEHVAEVTTTYGGMGSGILSVMNSHGVDISMNLHSVADRESKTLFTVEKIR